MRDVLLGDNQFTYSIEQNRQDNDGTPNRSFQVTVWVEDKYNQLSANPARLDAQNLVCAQPTNFTVETSFGVDDDTGYKLNLVEYHWDLGPESDLVKYRLTIDIGGATGEITLVEGLVTSLSLVNDAGAGPYTKAAYKTRLYVFDSFAEDYVPASYINTWLYYTTAALKPLFFS